VQPHTIRANSKLRFEFSEMMLMQPGPELVAFDKCGVLKVHSDDPDPLITSCASSVDSA